MNDNISTIARIISFTKDNDPDGVIRYAKRIVPENEWKTLESIIRDYFDPNAGKAVMD